MSPAAAANNTSVSFFTHELGGFGFSKACSPEPRRGSMATGEGGALGYASGAAKGISSVGASEGWNGWGDQAAGLSGRLAANSRNAPPSLIVENGASVMASAAGTESHGATASMPAAGGAM